MYLLYSHNVKDNSITPIDFSETSDEALKLLEEHVKEFIIEYEGKKKWDIAIIDEKTELNKLKDGYYLIKKNTNIEVYNKISNTVNTGWLLNSQETLHKLDLNYIYSISEFQRHLLNKFIKFSIPIPPPPPNNLNITNDISDRFKPNIQIRNNLNSIIEEIKKNGFKPVKRNKIKLII